MTGLIILAAGQSARMGRPKQKLLYQGDTLLQHAVKTALASVCEPVVVVLGAFADELLSDIESYPVKVIINQNWDEGMASSIRAGITQLQNIPGVSNALIMLCDQPHVNATLLDQMIQTKQRHAKGIVACAYNNTIGVPVLFGESYYPYLLSLTGHEGAKKILTAHTDDIETIVFPLGAVDIDTAEDYEGLG